MGRRHKYWGVAVDTYGNVLSNASVSIYLAGTTSPAKVYPSRDSTTPITTAPQITTDEYGYFEFWIDDDDYPPTQLFDIVVSKPGVGEFRIANERIVVPIDHDKLMNLLPEGLSRYYHLSEEQYSLLTQGQDASSLHHHNSIYYHKDVIDSWNLIKNYTLEQDLNANGYNIVNVGTINGNTAVFSEIKASSGSIDGDLTVGGKIVASGGIVYDKVYADQFYVTENKEDTGWLLDHVSGTPDYIAFIKSSVGEVLQIRSDKKVVVNNELKVLDKIGTSGYEPDQGLPSGWGGGVHTWDVYAEGSVGLGRNGKVLTWITHDPYNGGKILVRDVSEVDRILMYVLNDSVGGRIEVMDGSGNLRSAMYGDGRVFVGFDFLMARTVDGDFNWKRALVPWPTLLEINFGTDFTDGVKINGLLHAGFIISTEMPLSNFVFREILCSSEFYEYCTAMDEDIRGTFVIGPNTDTVSGIRVAVDGQTFEFTNISYYALPIVVSVKQHLKIELMGVRGYKYAKIYGFKW